MDRLNRIPAALIGVIAGLLAAVIMVVAAAGGFSELLALKKYAQVIRVIERDFVGEYDLDEITDGAMAGAVDSLDDMWSYYMDAETYAYYRDYAANRYQGIGVTITKHEETGGFLVLTVNRDGPAQKAGIEPDDIILAVDGTSVTEGDADFLRSLIQADFGKEAILTVQRGDGTREDITVSCEEIYSSPVSYTMLDGNVGCVAIANFRQGAGSEAILAVQELMEEGAQYLIFDVRSNPGGQITELNELLDFLLPEGDIFIRADRDGNEEIDRSDEACVELPIAVVVNGSSYSAAEYFAAALREYDRAIVVGEPTTGKARSQITVTLSDGSAVHISKYSYLTPKRVDLYEAGGLVPDVLSELTEEERASFDTGWLEPEEDPQILAAIEAIRS